MNGDGLSLPGQFQASIDAKLAHFVDTVSTLAWKSPGERDDQETLLAVRRLLFAANSANTRKTRDNFLWELAIEAAFAADSIAAGAGREGDELSLYDLCEMICERARALSRAHTSVRLIHPLITDRSWRDMVERLVDLAATALAMTAD